MMNYPHRPVSESPSAVRPARRGILPPPGQPGAPPVEALRAYLAEGLPAPEAAARSGEGAAMHNGMMIDAAGARTFEAIVQQAQACGISADEARPDPDPVAGSLR